MSESRVDAPTATGPRAEELGYADSTVPVSHDPSKGVSHFGRGSRRITADRDSVVFDVENYA